MNRVPKATLNLKCVETKYKEEELIERWTIMHLYRRIEVYGRERTDVINYDRVWHFESHIDS